MGNKNGGSGKGGGGGGGGGDRKPTSTGTGVVKTIGKLKKTDKTLEQKITLKEKKIAALKRQAKAKAKKGDKKGAIFCIRQIKLNQKNVEKMEKFRLNIQAQIQSLEDASTTALVADGMKATNAQLHTIQRNMNVEEIEDTRAALEEATADQEEIDDLLAEPMGAMGDMEDDELLGELEDIMDAEEAPSTKVRTAARAGTTKIDLPAVPDDTPVVLPSVPTLEPTASKVEEDELAGLEAMLN